MTPNPRQRAIWTIALLPFAIVIAFGTTSLGWPQDPQPSATQTAKSQRTPEQPAEDLQKTMEAPRFDPAIKAVALPAPGTTDPTRSSRAFRVVGDAVQPAQRLISFDVAFVDVDLHAWRDALFGAVKPAKRDSKMPAWTSDTPTLDRLRALVTSDPKASILQAPRAAAFEAGSPDRRRFNSSMTASRPRPWMNCMT